MTIDAERAFRLIQLVIDGRVDELPALLAVLDRDELTDLTALSLVFAADALVDGGDSLAEPRPETARKLATYIERKTR